MVKFIRISGPISTLFFIGSLLMYAHVYSQDREIVKITTEIGLSHSTVFDIAQDHYGLMWFGTREGLNRYDSHEVKTYYKEDAKGLPSNQINSLNFNSKTLWIGTERGLAKYDTDKDQFTTVPELKDISINDLFHSKQSELFISTKNGLFKMNREGKIEKLDEGAYRSIIEYKTNIFWVASDGYISMINSRGELIKKYKLGNQTNDNPTQTSAMVFDIFKDSQNVFWLGTSDGLYRYDGLKDSFSKSDLINQIGGPETMVVRAINEDPQGNLYFGGEAGIVIVNKERDQSFHIGQAFQMPNKLSDKAVYSLFISAENIVWAGTYFGGVNYFKPKGNAFKHFMPSEFENSISGKAISDIIKVKDGTLWIGTEDGGISIFDKNTGEFEHLRHSPKERNSLSSDNVHALFEDKDGIIWAGTFLGGLNRINPKTGAIRAFVNKPNDSSSISNDYVYAVLRDSQNRLWIGTQSGINLFNDQQQNFDRNTLPQLKGKFIYDLLEDQKKNLWITTRFGGIYKLDAQTGNLIHYNENNSGMCSNEIVAAYEDSKGKLWFGAINGGLLAYDAIQDKIECFDKANGLPNNNVYGIIENPSGGLWLTTNKGLALFDPNNRTAKVFTTADGLAYNQFNFKSSFKDDEDWIYFGSVKGLTYFHPDTLGTIHRSSRLFLKNLLLFNEPVSVSEDSPLKSSLNSTKHITLDHNQNAITLEFIGIDYISEGKNSYSYFLEGFDNGWNHVGDKKTATYTNLPHGEYVFHIKTNKTSENLSDLSSKSVEINVLPPFWKTNWAYALYILTFILLAYATYAFIRFVQAKNLAIRLEKVENEKIKEITKNRLNFFTFISHEFKTPLTLINAAIDQYSTKKGMANGETNEILSIQHSAKKLNHLVKQLMMFRKIETKHEKLNLVKGDVVLYIRDTFSAFDPLFTSRGLKSGFSTNIDSYYCHFDGHKMETILANLISNSIKNTDGGGEISLDLNILPPNNEFDNASITIRLTDTGHGFDEIEHEKLFSPFYTNSSNDPDKNGTGIGLSLVKSLIEFLDGKLSFRSEVGKGTVCAVTLPLLMDNPSNETIKDVMGNKSIKLPLDLMDENNAPTHAEHQQENNTANQVLLIAEDNAELRTFLAKHFSTAFKVVTAKDGKEAWQKIEKSTPDIVISDVKMPFIDGQELCHRIKTNNKYGHIPVLLLTAQSTEDKRLSGLNAGANAFLAKPFNLNELDISVRNLLNSAKSFESRFATLVSGKKVESMPGNNKDREFKLQVVNLIEANIENANFTIEELANSLGISRSLLHLRMKKITKVSASDFIKNLKMERAKELIGKGFPIAEVAYKVGFNDPNYFSRAFKKSTGMSPTSYIRKKRVSIAEE